MPLWTYTGVKFEKCPWQRISRPDKAMLYGCGQSLLTAPSTPNAVRFVQNHAHRIVTPHVWTALDKPEAFTDCLRKPGFPKVMRGNFSSDLSGGIPARDWPDTYFADVAEGSFDLMFFGDSGIDAKFVWAKNTMATTLHIMLWMGFRDIVFAGVDLHGSYFDGRILTNEQEESQARLHDQEFVWLKQFADCCRRRVIQLRTVDASSRLAEIMEVCDGDTI